MELVLVEVRHPRGHRGHDEADGGHADQRVAHGGDAQNGAAVLAQAADHVADEAPEAVREEGRPFLVGQLHLRTVSDVGPIGRAAARLGQAPAEVRHQQAGEERDEEGDAPAVAMEERSDGAADGQAHAEPDIAQALLDGEGLPAPFRPVVVGDDAAARGVGHGLAEAERGPDHHEQAEGRGRDQTAQGADDRPGHDGDGHGPGPVPAVGQVAGGERDDAIDEDEGGEEHADGGIAHPERRLDLVAAAPDDVLVHPVDEEGEPDHPHGPVRDEHAPGPRRRRGRRRLPRHAVGPGARRWTPRFCRAHESSAAFTVCLPPRVGSPPSGVHAPAPGVYPAGRAMDFFSRKDSRPSGPNSRPMPDSL